MAFSQIVRSLRADYGVAGERQGAMHDDFLSERGWDDVKLSPERPEDIAIDQAADRIEPKTFAEK